MSPLERLGLEVAANRLLGGRGQARMLTGLIEASGRPVAYEALWSMGSRNTEAINKKKAAQVRMCWLKACLDDVGLGGLVITHEGHGYALPDPGRAAVIDRLTEEAES